MVQKQIHANLHEFTFACMQMSFFVCYKFELMQKPINATLHKFTLALTHLEMQQQINANLHKFTYTLRDAKTN